MVKSKKSAVLKAFVLALTLSVLTIGCGSPGTGPGTGGNSGPAVKEETAQENESEKETAEKSTTEEESTASGLGEGAASGMKKGLFPGARKRAEQEQEQEEEKSGADNTSGHSTEDASADRTESADADRTESASADRTESADADRTESADADRTEETSEGRTDNSATARTDDSADEKTDDSSAGKTDDSAAGRTDGEDASEGRTSGSQTAGESRGLIVIDPGHQQYANMEQEPIGPGASETKISVSGGTSGVASGEPEHQLTLEISLLLRDELEKRGYTVIMVRETNEVDISNSDRAAMANDAGADAFVRIHANGSTDQSVTGAMTICQTPSNPYNGDLYEESRALSDSILEAYTQKTGIDYEYVWETDTMSGINWARVPVTILEMGYMSNSEEDLKMQDPEMQDRMAEGIADGIDRFIDKEEPEKREGSMPVDESLLQGENE